MLNNNGINILKWPTSFYDLSPVEDLWGIMKTENQKAGKKRVKEWKKDLLKIWNEITFATLRSFLESMLRRLQTIIDAKEKELNTNISVQCCVKIRSFKMGFNFSFPFLVT